jgi:FecR protein
MTTRGVRFLGFSVVLLALWALPAWAATNPATPNPADTSSNVRVVRLSLAQGDVQVDRNANEGWEQAINNMPLTEGARLYAAQDSKAELEFEDGSSIRLAGPGQISLNQLSFSPKGSSLNQIEVDSGLVYVNARLNDGAGFQIQDANGESFAITQPSHLRFKVDEQVASLAVMDGEAEALNDSGKAKIHAGETYNYILGQPESAVNLAKVQPESTDAWDQQRDQYDEQYAAAGAQYSGSDNPDAYGVADLGYYGSYQDIPGYGESWQPAGVGPDWNPYDNGAWSYYPDWGWTFVSAYPWGWAPFFYGDWCFVNGRGWWWHSGPWHGGGHDHGGGHGPGGGPHGPGGGFHPQPVLTYAPHGFSAPRPPSGSAHRTVAVAGSNLRVGPIGLTHASAAHSASTRATFTGAAPTRTTPAGSGPANSIAARGNAGSRATPSLPHGSPTSNRANSLIGGQRGAYYVTHPTPGRSAYDVHRPSSGYSGASSRGAYSGQSPRAYSYGNSYAPRTDAPRSYGVPYAPVQRAPATGYAPHVSSVGGFSGGGYSGGGGYHGGGGGLSGGGGFHGGGGGFSGGAHR